MAGDDADINWLRDERGSRLLVGVEAGSVKLAAVVPAGVPRSKVRRSLRECSRELEHYADAAEESGH